MISKLAVEDIEAMRKEGLSPSVEDIIRLNALGLKLERCEDCGDYFAMPRVAYLGRMCFREPTLAHGAWMDRAVTMVARDDYASRTAIHAYALSRQAASLPDAADRKRCEKAVRAFCKGYVSRFTFFQIHAAVEYAMYGADATAREYPEVEIKESNEPSDILRSIYVGRLVEGLSMSLGLSVRDEANLTLSQVEAVKTLAFYAKGTNPGKSARPRYEADYYATKFKIEERLKSEAEGAAEKTEAKDGK